MSGSIRSQSHVSAPPLSLRIHSQRNVMKSPNETGRLLHILCLSLLQNVVCTCFGEFSAGMRNNAGD